jgi:hypothetical protein
MDDDDDLDEELLIYGSPQFIFIPNPPNPIPTFFFFFQFLLSLLEHFIFLAIRYLYEQHRLGRSLGFLGELQY